MRPCGGGWTRWCSRSCSEKDGARCGGGWEGTVQDSPGFRGAIGWVKTALLLGVGTRGSTEWLCAWIWYERDSDGDWSRGCDSDWNDCDWG